MSVKKLILLLLVASAVSVAFASTTVVITFTQLPGTSGNGTTLTQSSTPNGETQATVAGIAAEELVCDDFTQTTYVPSGALDYSVNTISSLTSSDVDFDSGTIGSTTLTQVQAYDTVAVLLTELEALTVNGTNAQAITNYQYAIWDLLSPNGSDGSNSSIKDGPLNSAASTDLTTAFNDVKQSGTTNMNATQVAAAEAALVIYTPAAGYTSNQEFVGLSTPQTTTGNQGSTPEPSTWLLMSALGLILCLPQVRSRLSVVLHRS